MALQVIPTFQGGFAPAVANFSPVNTIGQMTRGVTDAQNVAANYLMNAAREVENQKQKEALAEWLSPSARVSREALREAATAGAGGWREEWGPSNTPYAAVGRDAGKITGATPLNEGVQQAIDGTYTDPVTGEQTDASGEPVDLFGDVLAEADSERAEMGGDAIAPEVAATATPTAKQEAVNKAVQQAMATAPAAAAPRAAPAAAIAQAATPPPSVQALPVGTDLGGGYYFDPLSPARRASAAAAISAAAQQRAELERIAARGKGRLEAEQLKLDAAKAKAAAGQKARKLVTWQNPDGTTENKPEGDPPTNPKAVPFKEPATAPRLGPDAEGAFWEKGSDGNWAKIPGPKGVNKEDAAKDKRIKDLQAAINFGITTQGNLDETDARYQLLGESIFANMQELNELMSERGFEVKSPEEIKAIIDASIKKGKEGKGKKKGGILDWFASWFRSDGKKESPPVYGMPTGTFTPSKGAPPGGAAPAKTAATTKPGEAPIYAQLPPQMAHIIGDKAKITEYTAILRQGNEAGWNNDQFVNAFMEKGLYK